MSPQDRKPLATGHEPPVFSLYPFRFHFRALDRVAFPPGQMAGNVIRGAFGSIFRKLACVPSCVDARSCEIRATCPYARIFEPAAAGQGPSGLADWPRPFVFRASRLDGCSVAPGDGFSFDVHLFDTGDPALAYFVLAFAQLAREGIGPGRGRAELLSAARLGADGSESAQVYDGHTFLVKELGPPLTLDLSPGAEPVSRILVHFVTPTELKSGAQLVPRPEFGVLFARIRDRVSTLRALYGPGPLGIDFHAMGERAARVRLARWDGRHAEVERRSSKTGQVHPLGGFTGEAEYEGDLTEFLPYLRAARWTGVGRQTVWGKGEIRIPAVTP